MRIVLAIHPTHYTTFLWVFISFCHSIWNLLHQISLSLLGHTLCVIHICHHHYSHSSTPKSPDVFIILKMLPSIRVHRYACCRCKKCAQQARGAGYGYPQYSAIGSPFIGGNTFWFLYGRQIWNQYAMDGYIASANVCLTLIRVPSGSYTKGWNGPKRHRPLCYATTVNFATLYLFEALPVFYLAQTWNISTELLYFVKYDKV